MGRGRAAHLALSAVTTSAVLVRAGADPLGAPPPPTRASGSRWSHDDPAPSGAGDQGGRHARPHRAHRTARPARAGRVDRGHHGEIPVLAAVTGITDDVGDAPPRAASRGATTCALLEERVAWAHPRAGDIRHTERALSAVDTAYDRRRAADDPEWVYWLDEDEIAVMAGRCYVELGRPSQAIPLLTEVPARYDERQHASPLCTHRGSLRRTCRPGT